MTENAQQAQDNATPESQEQDTSASSSAQATSPATAPATGQDFYRSGGTDTENGPMIPKGRWDETNREKKELAAKLEAIHAEREREAEERAKKQGEYQSLADKYKKQAETEKQRRLEIESSWTRERRLNVWSRASSGIIKAEAMADAFSMLDETDFENVSEEDEAGFKRLAESLADRKPYLADGPRGAGSGGSKSPVLVGGQSSNGQQKVLGGRQPLLHGRKRPSWK
jgi:hypothetical protein